MEMIYISVHPEGAYCSPENENSGPGMKFFVNLVKQGSINMSINFCGHNRAVAQHLLYGPQIRASFKQMSGK